MEIINQIEELLEIARNKVYTDNEAGLEALNKAYDLSLKHNYKRGEAWSILRRGSYLYRDGKRYEAVELYKSALKMMNEIEDFQGVSRAYYLIGTVYSLIGEFAFALQNYLQALKLSDTYDPKYHYKVLNNLAATYYRLGKYDHGIDTIEKAISHMMNHNIEGLYMPYTTMGEIFLKKEAYKEALECAEKALEYLELVEDIGFRANADLIIAEAFKGLKFYDEALIVYNRALKTYEEAGDTQNNCLINRGLAEIYLIKKEFQKAFEHCQSALTDSHKYKSVYDETKVYKLYADIYEELNDFEKAFKYLKKAYALENQTRLGINKDQLNAEISPEGGPISSDDQVGSFLFDRVIGELSSTYESVSYLEKAKLTDAFVETIVDTIDMRDSTTSGHSKRIAFYATEMLKQLSEDTLMPYSFTENEIKEMYYSALLHDIGKLSIRESVLLKSQRLSESRILALEYRFSYIKLLLSQRPEKSPMEVKIEGCLKECLEFIRTLIYENYIDDETYDKLQRLHDMYLMDNGQRLYLLDDYEFEHLSVRKGNLVYYEMEDMRTHAIMTKKILEHIPWLEDVENIPTLASSHHEKLDGSGYPRGLQAHEINTQMRILSIVDIFEALTASDRPYKSSFTIEEALNILRIEVKEGKLDGDLVEYFAKTGICYHFKEELKGKS